MQSQSFASRYLTMKREKMAHGWTLAKRNKGCYLFLAPYAILFFTFFILPIGTSIFYSFTYYNILEPARFIGFQNYINLVLQDEVFLTAVKNTFVCAVIIGPVGYILSFLFAWFINELPKWLRAVAVIVFYAPSIGGAAFLLSGRHINTLLNDAENLSRGAMAQYFIRRDGGVMMERKNDGEHTLHTDRGPYPDPWLLPWLQEREFGAIIRKEPGGTMVYCCAYVPSMEFWYLEKIDLKRCLESLDKARKEATP